MATAPIRPKAYANWLTQVTATTPAPADTRHHALCLFGQAAQLFTRWCPTVLAPELCNRQTFTQYDETVLESIAASTHLVVVRDCDVSAVWRDRNAIEEALRDVYIVFLFPELQPRTNTRCWFLAERIGMTAAGSIFSCVDAMDLYKSEERVDQPPMKLTMPAMKIRRWSRWRQPPRSSRDGWSSSGGKRLAYWPRLQRVGRGSLPMTLSHFIVTINAAASL